MSVNWNYYDKFDDVLSKYLPMRGEGENLAQQIVTAVNKLIYKWYNDGDVYDNNYYLDGWANDLSSYANWLYKNVDELKPILDKIYNCRSESEYEDLLKHLADHCLDIGWLEYNFEDIPKRGSIYDCDGPYSFDMYKGEDDEDEEDDEYWEDDEYDY